MDKSFHQLQYSETGYFSRLVLDYLSGNELVKPFYKYSPTHQGIQEAISSRSQFPVNRTVLVDTLKKQYAAIPVSEATAINLNLLENENTFTVTTAHQPNLLTGYLYFIYKIIHTIKLCKELKEKYPEKNFVPVYYMGSEDNDIEELGVFSFRGEKYIWDGSGQSGAVGRMHTDGLKPLFTKLFTVLGPPGQNCNQLEALIKSAYYHHSTISEATQYIVNELFGDFGLVILNPDDRNFKALYINVMKDELLHQNSYTILLNQIEKLGTNYKVQANPRNINLFYLKDNLRERIEKKGTEWIVLNTEIKFTESELLNELNSYPERFSPNVMLRGMFQETILPNIAFIGGGGELAYWLQLRTLFESYGVFYPCLLLRQSVLWIDNRNSEIRKKMGLDIPDLFLKETKLLQKYIESNTDADFHTQTELFEIDLILNKLRSKATVIDQNLIRSVDATLTKVKHHLETLEKKMYRAQKRKMEVQLNKVIKLQQKLFPNHSLQERVENFSEYYLEYGNLFINTLFNLINPLSNEFLIIE